jgi:tRNA threonylcarbamoyladenosine biosynthesis protein TsaE
MSQNLYSESALLGFGGRLAGLLQAGDIITLSGPLGAGKTTLARGILTGLGWADEVASPTFPLVIPYDPPALRLPLWHADLYRIEGLAAVAELALTEILVDGVLLVEWPERWGEAVPPTALRLTLALAATGRILTAAVPPAWKERWRS